MLSVTHRSETNGGSRRHKWEPVSRSDQPDGFIPALFSGGDDRLAIDPRTGLNKYLCPAMPIPDLICASSCTASPISARGFGKAADAFLGIVGASSPRQRAHQLMTVAEQIKARLLKYFDVDGLAWVMLCPSGTDALLTAAMLMAAQRPGEAMTAILPSASETGTGVPLAAMCRVFDGPSSGKSLTDRAATVVEIPLRSTDGAPRGENEINDAFAAAMAGAKGSVVVYLTHGTKTGLIAPVSPPPGADVIVDASQARIEPETVAAYLRKGWPVVVTGSKFFGGPAFSGAAFFPEARFSASRCGPLPSAPSQATNLGTVLRWTAAIDVMDAFEPLVPGIAGVLSNRGGAIERAVASSPALVSIGGFLPNGSGWAGLPSIFTFGVRDPANRARLLSMAELRLLYKRLAGLGVLLGQPVDLGPFGGLRIAIGARDLLNGAGDVRLARAFAALEEVTTSRCRFDGGC
jgi:hypothetical protein